MSIIVLIACGTEQISDGPTEDAPLPSAHTYSAEPPQEIDPADLTEAVLSSLERLLTVQPAPILDAYDAALTYGSEQCPNETVTVEDGTTTAHWQEVCTSPAQEALFNGPMTTWTWDAGHMTTQTLPPYDDLFQFFPEMSELRWTGAGLNGQTDITAADGTDFNCSCLALSGQSEADDTQHAFIALDGPSHWSGSEATGTWIQDNIKLRLSGFATKSEAGRYIFLSGSASGLDDDYGAIDFTIPLQTTETGCESVPLNGNSLTITTRQTETGHWTTLELSKPMMNSCTFCTQDDVFCLDLTPLLSWEELPW